MYSEIRWLSLGKAITSIVQQWTCLLEFFKSQLSKKKELKLTKDQILFLENLILKLKDNSFKYLILLFEWTTKILNNANILFQSRQSQLHNIWPQSRLIYNTIAQLKLPQNQENTSNFLANEIFLEKLQNEIEFNQTIFEYEVNLKSLAFEMMEFSKKFFKNLLLLTSKYLPIDDNTIKGFQLLDPSNHTLQNSKYIFRESLLKKFVSCYGFLNYEQVLQQFSDFSLLADEKLPLQLENYKSSSAVSRYNVEKFWIDMYNIEPEKNPFALLSNFFVNLLTIQSSNSYVEERFSQVKLIKTEKRNLLEVATVASILKVKSYYENKGENFNFEPEEKNYYFYGLIVNSYNV